jgi:hypothetical protein
VLFSLFYSLFSIFCIRNKRMDAQNDPQARRLAEALVANEDEADCLACLDGLEAYVDAQLAGEDYLAQMPQVAQHLDTCVACAEAYALVYEVRLAEANLPLPARIPPPDLAFLRSPLQRLQELLAGAVEPLATGLRLVFSQALLAALDALPSTAAPALRGEFAAAPLFELLLANPAPAVESLHLSLYPDGARPGLGTLRAQLALVGRDWPDLAGINIVVRWLGAEQQATSDEWGEALIPGVPLDVVAQLVVEVITSEEKA